MSDEKDILSTIELLSNRVLLKEEETNKLKKLVNELCAEAGIKIRFPNISDTGVGVSTRKDQFYGQTLTAAIRSYLDQRKALGAASVQEIYSAIRDGGYKFETKSEEIAKISVGNALRKTSSVFHKLPNGNYGLLSWYPSAKAAPETQNGNNRSKSKKSKSIKDLEPIVSPEASIGVAVSLVTNNEIRDVVLARGGDFKSSDIVAAVREKYPTKLLRETKVPTVLFILKKKGLIKVISPKVGSKPAVWSKA